MPSYFVALVSLSLMSVFRITSGTTISSQLLKLRLGAMLPNITIHRTSGKLRLPTSGDLQR